MVAHWHFFKRSFDNAAFPDYYQTGYLDPAGESGVHLAYGGYLRDRPPYRAPRSGTATEWVQADFAEDIATARRMFIDAFQYNSGSVATGSTTDTALMLAAAAGTPFKVLLGVDCDSVSGQTNAAIAAYINAYRTHPNALRRANGTLMVGCYRPETLGSARWAAILAAIGEPVFFMPTFLDAGQYSSFASLVQGASIWDGSNYLSYAGGISTFKGILNAAGKAFACPVWPQDHRPSAQQFREARGSRTARVGWEHAIATQPDYVFMHTWNDYSEGHHWQPSLRTQYAYADLARYYAQWYKTGTQPAIVRDVLYYFHRIERTDAAGTGTSQSAPRFADQVNGGTETYNEIELLGFLTAPGTLDINGNQLSVGAGLQAHRVTWASGQPLFKLIRGGDTVISLLSNFTNRTASSYQDLQYRGGGSTRAPVPVS